MAKFTSLLFAMACCPGLLQSNEPDEPGILGWEAQNATLNIGYTGLDVLAGLGEFRPFLTNGNVKRNDKFKATLKLKITGSGTVGVAWKLKGQDEFEKKHSIYKLVKPKDGSQKFTLSVPVEGEATEFKVFVPYGDSVIQEIRFQGGGEELVWLFVPEE